MKELKVKNCNVYSLYDMNTITRGKLRRLISLAKSDYIDGKNI